ncbi:ABC transporter ATP-binding protein [Pseudonocardia sp. CA-107938]|uniref:ABC transporter ATP-binding protein n=1 Tax=Pseudonocardia sp. CA-107938 TaxID=3240021 RepID=UPI003D8D9293
MTAPSLRAENVRVRLASGPEIVRGVDLQLRPGEILGLVGESGSGKTTLARALMGYASPGTEISAGQLWIDGEPVAMDETLRRRRGVSLSYVPQDPGRSLNPALRLQDTLQDVIRTHRGSPADDAELERHFAGVGLPGTAEFRHRLPHQLSGGQQQRVCIATALTCDPPVVILDEPTTGLDVVTQSRIITELARLRDEHHVSMIYVSHDLAVVSQIADRVAVMYNGRLVEQGPARELLSRPRHPYTRGLLVSTPDHLAPRRLEPMGGMAPGVGDESTGCAFAPRCPIAEPACERELPALQPIDDRRDVRCAYWTRTPAIEQEPLQRSPAASVADRTPVLDVADLAVEYRSGAHVVPVAADVSFALHRGSCVALVGESGSGKTSIARSIAGLLAPASGEIRLDGERLPPLARDRSVAQRRRIQLVFQNPADSLNPRRTVADQIARPAALLRRIGRADLAAETGRLLDAVRLPSRLKGRYPHELSGGERQRVAIARALAAGPEVLVCDEVTSALDVSVQAAVLDLLGELRSESGLSLLFITHDLGVVATIADHVLVLDRGTVCEQGAVQTVLKTPEATYTKGLLAAAPSVSELLHHDRPAPSAEAS